MEIKIERSKAYETFTGFGASGAWWAQIVGGWTHTDEQSGMAVRDRISQLLYDPQKGIGLNIYRYNIGAGSKYSSNGYYSEPARRTESFLIGGGKLDMTRDANAVYMMRRAVQDGADEVILFVNSPPVQMTKNGGAHQDKHKLFRENLSRKQYTAFADYCLDVAEYFMDEGLPVRYLSPINEPTWAWNGGQEGCFYRPDSVHRLFSVFVQRMMQRPKLANLKLSGVEIGDLRFFNKTYTHALLSDPVIRGHVDAVDVHSYCQPIPLPVLGKVPALGDRLAFARRFRRFMDEQYPSVPIKVSEWTHMQGGRDRGMDSALVTANTIMDDLTILRAVSWQHWIAVSEVDYCDGLIYIDLYRKTFETTKRLYATGNFSKYIRPGARRLACETADPELKAICYQVEDKTVVVVINNAGRAGSLTLPTDGMVLHALTDETHDLSETEHTGTADFVLPPRSVNTFVF